MATETSKRTTLDVRGEICPYPMLKAVEAMRAARGDETIEVVTDHAPALVTVPHQAKKLGWTADVHELGGAEWRIILTKTASH